ncbi:30S ribosomal protein S16 [Candidatus Nomurabacteria bacterium]|nr:30S ribosomal protein S16 [Candidatus Nomurabacteria bacterium]
MLKIRLQRVGRKNDPSFRVVVMPKQKDSQSGKVVEILGSYSARQGKPQIKADRVKHWIAAGAQVSDTVHNLLINQKIIEGKKINVLPKRKPVEKIEEKVEAKTEEKREEVSAAESPVEAVPAN